MSTIFAIALVWQSFFLNHKTLENAKIAGQVPKLKCVQSPTYKKTPAKLEVLDEISLVFINHFYKGNFKSHSLEKSTSFKVRF